MIRGSERQRVASRRAAPRSSSERHALRLATALSSVVCDQEDGDEAEAEAEDEDEDVNGGGGDGGDAGNKEAASEGEDVLLVREYVDEGTRAAGMNDDVVNDVAEEDPRGDAREGSATTTTTTTKTTTSAFLVYTPTAVRSARLTTPGCGDSAVVPANEIAPPRSACT